MEPHTDKETSDKEVMSSQMTCLDERTDTFEYGDRTPTFFFLLK